MPSPSNILTTQRPDLGATLIEFDLMMDSLGFIGQKILPVFNTAKQAGVFGRIPLKELLQKRETRRAPGGSYNRGSHKFVDQPYATSEHGLEEPVDDREAEMYREYFDAEVIATGRAQRGVVEAQESRVAGLVFNAATWNTSDLKTAVTHEWDDWANATPIDDIEAAVLKVYDGCGLWPNALVLTRKVFRNLRNCEQIIERLKYNGIVDVRAENITAQALAQVFDLPQILVAGGTKNIADEGLDAVLEPIWSPEYAMVARVATTNDIKEPCLGRIMHWSGDGSEIDGLVETYRDETVRSWITRVRHDVQELILYKEAAHLLENITTTA